MQLEMKYSVGKEIELRKNVNEDEWGVRVHFVVDGTCLLLILLLTMLREL